MQKTRKHLELLAPAKNADYGIEAINHGADAVYIGGPAFGARAKAPNTVQDIARLVQHAHRFHAEVFVALNTIFTITSSKVYASWCINCMTAASMP